MTLIPTGLPTVDALLDGGLRPGKLTLVCGLSQSGMTTMLDTIAAQAIRQQTPTVLADLETPSRVRLTRLSAALSGVPFTAIRDGNLTDAERAAVLAGDSAGAPFWLAHDIAILDDLRWQLRLDGITARLALVDGLRLLGDGNTTRTAWDLADLAQERNVAVVATLPAARHPDLPAGDVPVAALAAAHTVLMLHRRSGRVGEVEVTAAGRGGWATTYVAADFERARFLDTAPQPVVTS